MPADFHWLRPEWLLAVPLVIAVAVVLGRRRLQAGSWERVIEPALMPFVLSRNPGRGSDLRWWLYGAGGVLAALSLAGPAWERIEQPVFRAEQALVVALDLSRSMDAEDVTPSRLVRARLKILDILERRKSGQTALVVYSANAFTVTPLTNDTDTVAALINSLSTDIMPSRGSYPIVAMEKSRQLLDQAGVAFGEVLLVTDGGSSPAAETAARDLKAAGYTLSVLAVGTDEGAPIPRPAGGFVTDNRGNIALPRLEKRSLRALAVAGGGKFAVLSADDSDLDVLLSGVVAKTAATDESMATDQWREEGPWLLLLLLPIAALAFRRGWLLVVVLCIAPLPQTAEASLWDDLWQNKNQQARDLLESGNAADAATLFDDTEWRAVARYRAGDYTRSAAEFAERGDARNLYNLGNAMAMQGELDAAIDAYEQVLEMEPDNEDAAYNLELVKNAKEQQQQQENQGDQQQSEESRDGDSDSSSSEESSEQQSESEASDSDSQSADGESPQRDEDEMNEEDLKALQEELQRAAEEAQQGEEQQQLSEAELAELRAQQEQEQAMEQWLRRVPDDPGGLLRRKFRYQYQRSGKDQDGNSVWPDNEAQPW
ncbi:MAG: VWA domain-containing protein [Gammaproteobacteria bacterium]|nr:VWA domain-containing protein [Gammaproteobacteria bacterium]